jgi:bifunctional DNA-binding transcriptional regulator/antitoxin component of YhaV-PrlF toxin-antitoxin module
MSGKAQLVVPRRIRENEGFKSTDRFAAIEVRGGVLFKRVVIPEVKIEFESLSRHIRSHLKRQS